MAVAGTVPFACLFVAGRRLSAYIDDERIEYQGLLESNAVEWRQVISVTQRKDLPYPRRQYYGPFTYEVLTADGPFMVNLLFFPREFGVAFRDQVKRHGLSRRFRDRAF